MIIPAALELLQLLDCEYYIQCGEQNQANGVNKCPEGLVFNEKEKYCDYPEMVAPPCGSLAWLSRILCYAYRSANK